MKCYKLYTPQSKTVEDTNKNPFFKKLLNLRTLSPCTVPAMDRRQAERAATGDLSSNLPFELSHLFPATASGRAGSRPPRSCQIFPLPTLGVQAGVTDSDLKWHLKLVLLTSPPSSTMCLRKIVWIDKSA